MKGSYTKMGIGTILIIIFVCLFAIEWGASEFLLMFLPLILIFIGMIIYRFLHD